MTDQQPAPLQPPATAAALTLSAPAAAPAGRGDRRTADGSRRRGRGTARAGRQGRRLPRVADGGSPTVAGVRRQGHRRAHHGRHRHPAGSRDVEPAAELAGEGPAGGRAGRGVQGRLDAARAAPHDRGPRPEGGDRGQEVPRHGPVRRQGHRLLPQVPVGAEPPRRHPARPARRPGRARQGQRRAQPGEAVPLGRDGPAEPVRVRRRAARRRACPRASPSWRRPTPTRPRRCATTCSSTSARSTRTC